MLPAGTSRAVSWDKKPDRVLPTTCDPGHPVHSTADAKVLAVEFARQLGRQALGQNVVVSEEMAEEIAQAFKGALLREARGDPIPKP